MAEVNLIVRTADRKQKAEVTVADTQKCGDIIQAAVENWKLDKDEDYAITNVSTAPPKMLAPEATLVSAGITDGEILEIQPVLRAGWLS